MPAYPNPPDPFAPLPIRTRARQRLGQALAAAYGQSGQAQSEPARILLIRPDHLGDLLFLSPALRWLREEMAAAHLTLAIGPWGVPALPGLKGTYDELLVIPFPGFERGVRASVLNRWKLLPVMARRLRDQRYDSAIIYRPDHWWGAMLAAMAGIPRRLGYDTPETAPWLSKALTLPYEHSAASNLRLSGVLLGQLATIEPLTQPLSFAVRQEDRQAVRDLLASLPIKPGQRIAVIHPGSGAAVKLWDAEKWGDVAKRLAAQGMAVLVTGGPGVDALAADIVNASGEIATDLSGRTSFGVLAALLAASDLVLGPDSGPLHLAAAVGTPTVHLYGPADPVRFGPWGDRGRHIVLQSDWTCIPCGKFDWPDLPAHGCVRDIAIEQVWAAARKLLANPASK